MTFEARPRKQSDVTPPDSNSDAPRALPQLPLGSNAYRSPLFTAQERSAETSRSAQMIIAGAAIMSAAILALALAYRPTQDPELVARDSDSVVPSAPRAIPQPPAAARQRSVAPVAPPAAIVSQSSSDLVFPPASKHRDLRRARRHRGSTRSGSRPERPRELAVAVAVTNSQLPEAPSRAAVIAAMTRVTPAALACFAGERGVAHVTFSVRGKTGRVNHARVTGLAGAAGSCVARAVRRATFPKFRKDRLEISYPFRR